MSRLSFSPKLVALGATVTLFCSTTTWASRDEVIKELAGKGYFKVAKCSDVANVILVDNGLPEIGKTSPVKGTRGSFDRAKATETFPEFSDEVTIQGVKTSLKAEKFDTQEWALSLVRSAVMKANNKSSLNKESQTEFQFNASSGDSCVFKQLMFRSSEAKNQDGKPSSTMIFNTGACIDLFSASSQQGSNHELEWLKRDCALALHFAKQSN